jgi:hypothetical protein
MFYEPARDLLMASGLSVCSLRDREHCNAVGNCEALATIDQRLLSPIETGDEESGEIENAQRGLLTLKDG